MQDQMSGVENAGSENAKPENPRNGGSTAGMVTLFNQQAIYERSADTRTWKCT